MIFEYRFTSLTLWNERDPYSWNLYGSNDGEDVEEVTLRLDQALVPGERFFLRVDVEMEE